MKCLRPLSNMLHWSSYTWTEAARSRLPAIVDCKILEDEVFFQNF